MNQSHCCARSIMNQSHCCVRSIMNQSHCCVRSIMNQSHCCVKSIMNQSHCCVRNFRLRYYTNIPVNELWLVGCTLICDWLVVPWSVIGWLYLDIAMSVQSSQLRPEILKGNSRSTHGTPTHGQLTELRLKQGSLKVQQYNRNKIYKNNMESPCFVVLYDHRVIFLAILQSGITVGYYSRVLQLGITVGYYSWVLQSGITVGYYSRVIKTELGRNTLKKLSFSVCEVTTKWWIIGILDFPNELGKGTLQINVIVFNTIEGLLRYRK